jgi:hypothetical protein
MSPCEVLHAGNGSISPTARRLERRRIINDTTIRSINSSDRYRPEALALSRYPAVKLVNARELARNAQRSRAGGDPAVEKRAREALTFGALASKYIDDYAKPRKRSWQEDQRQLNADLLPK